MELRIIKYGNLMGSPDCKELLHRAGVMTPAADAVWNDIFRIKTALGLTGQATTALLLEPSVPDAFPALVDFSFITPGSLDAPHDGLPVQAALESLRAHDLEPDAIKSLLVTHLHPDHFDVHLVAHLPQAKIYAPFERGRDAPMPGLRRFSPEPFAGRIEAIDTPGHGTPHTSYVFDLPQYDLTVCLAGDLVMSHAHYLSLDHPLSFADHDQGQASIAKVHQALEARERKHMLIVPGHDIPFFHVG